jgi:hypothetical protein
VHFTGCMYCGDVAICANHVLLGGRRLLGRERGRERSRSTMVALADAKKERRHTCLVHIETMTWFALHVGGVKQQATEVGGGAHRHEGGSEEGI